MATSFPEDKPCSALTAVARTPRVEVSAASARSRFPALRDHPRNPSQPAGPAVPAPAHGQSTPNLPAASQPVTKRMAIASLALSFVADFSPGHRRRSDGAVSRQQIAKSQGRQSGTGLTFAGSILSYLQLAVMALLFAGLTVMLFGVNRELDRHPDVRIYICKRGSTHLNCIWISGRFISGNFRLANFRSRV